MDGLFHGKFHIKMDVWGGTPSLGNLQFGCLIHTFHGTSKSKMEDDIQGTPMETPK